MSWIEVKCPKCGGTEKITCNWCHGQGGWSEIWGGETRWKPCPYCTDQGTPGLTRCDNGCVGGRIRVWRDD